RFAAANPCGFSRAPQALFSLYLPPPPECEKPPVSEIPFQHGGRFLQPRGICFVQSAAVSVSRGLFLSASALLPRFHRAHTRQAPLARIRQDIREATHLPCAAPP